MCIGVPMKVIAIEPGHAQCEGRGESRRVRTALVGPVTPGEWVLVFIDSAQERISLERAQEINATLDLLEAAVHGHVAETEVAFALPSSMGREQLLCLSGASVHQPQETFP